MLFGWELVLSFILVSVVYAVAIGEPSFGNIAPFAVGLSLVVDLFAGAQCAFDVPEKDCSIVLSGHDTLTLLLAISCTWHNDRQTPVTCAWTRLTPLSASVGSPQDMTSGALRPT
jgi:hypothetical protein